MRTYKGQPFEPTVTPRRRKPKPKPLKLRTAPNRDRLVRPKDEPRDRPAGKRLLPAQGRNRNAGRNSDPGRPTPPPADPFAAEVKALLDLKYGEEQAAIKAEGPVSAQQHTNIQGWYQGYLDDLQKAAQMTSQMYGGAQAATYGQANTAAGQDQARMAQNQQQAQASAALRGTSASVQPEQAAAIGARQASTTNFGSFLAAQGGAAATLDAGRYSAAGAARVGAHEQESAREAELRAGARKIMAQRAAEQVTLRSELQDAELKRRAIIQEYGLDKAKLKVDAKDKAGRRRLTKRAARQTRRESRRDFKADRSDEQASRADKAEDNALNRAKERRMLAEANKPPSGSNGPSNLTPTQRRGYQQKYQQAIALLRTDPKWSPKKADQFVDALTASGYPRAIARAAVLRASAKPVPPGLARQLRRFGVKVKATRPRRSPGDIIGDVFDDVAGR